MRVPNETGSPPRRLWAIAVAILVTVPLAAAGIVQAAIPETNTGEITVCYKPYTGQMRLIDTESGPACASDEQDLSWSQEGPKGDPGPPPPILVSTSTTNKTVDPMPTAATAVDSMSVTIPGSDAVRNAIVTAFVSGTTTSESNRRFGIYLDGTLQFPFHGNGSQSQYNDSNIKGNGWSWTASGAISIPGDSASHTIEVRGQAKDDTNSTTYKNRSLGVVVG